MQVVLITGASSGIGRATALVWANRGARLVLCARSADVLDEVRAECADVGAEVEVVVTDVTDRAQVQHAVDTAVTRFGRLDVCVSAAGVVAYGSHTETPADVFAQVIATNLTGAANVARSALTVFREQGEGSLVMVGSLLGRVAVPEMGSYVASKWGLRGLTRVLQQESRDSPDVHVSLVSPGSVRTPIYDEAGTSDGSGASAPAPSTSPRTVAHAIVAAATRSTRESDVDAFGGALNKVISGAFSALPDVFDVVAGPLMRRNGRAGTAGAGNIFTPRSADERSSR